LAGIAIAGLEWPGVSERSNQRRGGLAWAHALRLALRAVTARLRGRTEPVLVISHAPPAGAGDVATDAYHVGFPAYRWLMGRLHPPLWLHGHTTAASVTALDAVVGATTLVNVTGAVLVELVPPDAGTA
jgi:Icc-related predicted phosphoesterase